MKKAIVLLFLAVIFINCSKPSECVESAGTITSKTFQVPTEGFTKITVYEGISLVITQGTDYKIEVQAGENLIKDVEVKVSDGLLTLRDNTTCNMVRDYGQITAYVTAPNVTDFVSKTSRTISSNGLLTYPVIRLNALDLSDGAGTGDFNFQINNAQVVIESNNVSNFYISGQTNDMLASFYEGNGRIEATNFLADNIQVFHRGSNDMVLHPLTKIKGDMYSTGNILCKNHSVINEVVSHYNGQVIFN